ncbi:hypothetical protein DN752_22600 [Echinicola strongylocentroti]|uniref:DUF5018 domain-containing protein n=2 Tax=Echinicola strongylocentroti TaxID=1795355 RepID=A0A2Z4IPR7_9BACT|nr:hypothetical protein DN752_22600 [Echinicola strongylocentroti]
MDLSQYGDTAFLLDARLFRLEEADRQVWEEDGVVTGARRVFISEGAAVIDNDNFTATITISEENADYLSLLGITFTHRAMKIEPVGDAPRAGIPADFSDRSFVYTVHSADGTTHDWTVFVEVEGEGAGN